MARRQVRWTGKVLGVPLRRPKRHLAEVISLDERREKKRREEYIAALRELREGLWWRGDGA